MKEKRLMFLASPDSGFSAQSFDTDLDRIAEESSLKSVLFGDQELDSADIDWQASEGFVGELNDAIQAKGVPDSLKEMAEKMKFFARENYEKILQTDDIDQFKELLKSIKGEIDDFKEKMKAITSEVLDELTIDEVFESEVRGVLSDVFGEGKEERPYLLALLDSKGPEQFLRQVAKKRFASAKAIMNQWFVSMLDKEEIISQLKIVSKQLDSLDLDASLDQEGKFDNSIYEGKWTWLQKFCYRREKVVPGFTVWLKGELSTYSDELKADVSKIRESFNGGIESNPTLEMRDGSAIFEGTGGAITQITTLTYPNHDTLVYHDDNGMHKIVVDGALYINHGPLSGTLAFEKFNNVEFKLADGKIEFRLPEGCKMGVIGNRFYIIGEVHSDIEEGVIGEEDNPLSRHLNGLKSMNQTVKDNLIGIIQYTASLNINYISILFDANGAKDIFKHEGKKAVARLRRELDAVWVEKAEKQKLFTDLSDALSELGAIDQSAKLVQVEGSEFFRFENADYEENWTDFQKSLFRRNQKFPGFIDFLTDELDQYLVNMEAQIESM